MMVQETTQEQGVQETTDNEQVQPESDQMPENPSLDAGYVERLKKDLEKTRSEAAKYRTERNETKTQAETLQQQIQAINKALGGKDESPDPETLQQELQRTQETAKRNAIEAVAVRHVSKLDIRPDRIDTLLALAEPKLNALDLGDDGKPDGKAVATVLDDLAGEYPEWKRQSGNIGSGTNPPQQPREVEEVAELEKRLDTSTNRAERAGIIRRITELRKG